MVFTITKPWNPKWITRYSDKAMYVCYSGEIDLDGLAEGFGAFFPASDLDPNMDWRFLLQSYQESDIYGQFRPWVEETRSLLGYEREHGRQSPLLTSQLITTLKSASAVYGPNAF